MDKKDAKNSKTALRPLHVEDAALVYKWQLVPETRKYFRNSEPPQWETHCAWIRNIVDDPNRHAYIVVADGAPAGLIRIEKRDDGTSYEVSILLDPACYGRGIAGTALQQIQSLHHGLVLWAEILPGNERSFRLFTRAGFSPAGGTWYKKAP